MTTTEPINVAYGGFRHRAQVEALVVSSMWPPDADPEAYLDNSGTAPGERFAPF